jgi:hypothetical protein
MRTCSDWTQAEAVHPTDGSIRLPPKQHAERADGCHVLNTGLMLTSVGSVGV